MIKDPIFSTLKKSSKSLRPAAGNQSQLVLQLLQLLWRSSCCSCCRVGPCLPASSTAAAPQRGKSTLESLKALVSWCSAAPGSTSETASDLGFAFQRHCPCTQRHTWDPVTLTLSPIWGLDLAHYRNHFRPTSGHQGPLDGQI